MGKPERQSRRHVWICGPYRGDVVKNVEIACTWARAVYAVGAWPVVPHVMTHLWAIAAEDDVVLHELRRHLEECNLVLVLPVDWTRGMRAEIEHAYHHGVPVVYALSPEISLVDEVREALARAEPLEHAAFLKSLGP